MLPELTTAEIENRNLVLEPLRALLGKDCLPPPTKMGARNRWHSSTNPALIAWAARLGPLPREASPAKVAKDGQYNHDNDDDPKPGRHRDPFVRSMPILRRADGSSQREDRAGVRRRARTGDTAAITCAIFGSLGKGRSLCPSLSD
jgi:hypothetical protein